MITLLAIQKIKSLALLAILVTATLSLSACNTIEGAGKDVERAGKKVQEAAK